MFENLRQKLYQFMQGRYGMDDLNRTLMYVTIALILVQLFVHNNVLNVITLILIVLVYFRMLSRNITKRYQENRLFLEKTSGLRDRWAKLKYELSQRKQYHIYKCPACGQKIRVPRGKGKIAITCRKCGNEFVKNS